MIETTDEYWDCDCDKQYIHKSSDNFCGTCGFSKEDGADSRVNELKEENMHIGINA